jgi:hypothetical protein
VSARRTYSGPALDGTVQHISEAPHWQDDGETVDVIDEDLDSAGEESVENVPVPDGCDRPDTTGQMTLGDYVGGSR